MGYSQYFTLGPWNLVGVEGELSIEELYRNRHTTLGDSYEILNSAFTSGSIELHTKNFIWHPNFLLVDIGGEFSPTSNLDNYLVTPDRSEARNLRGLNMKAIKRSEQLQTQYQQLKKKLSDIGPVCQGSVIERCYNRSVKGKQTLYGPYYSWTRKVANKTVTVALSKDQYRHMSKAITAHRKVEDILKKMCKISEELVMLQAQGVVTRKSH